MYLPCVTLFFLLAVAEFATAHNNCADGSSGYGVGRRVRLLPVNIPAGQNMSRISISPPAQCTSVNGVYVNVCDDVTPSVHVDPIQNVPYPTMATVIRHGKYLLIAATVTVDVFCN